MTYECEIYVFLVHGIGMKNKFATSAWHWNTKIYFLPVHSIGMKFFFSVHGVGMKNKLFYQCMPMKLVKYIFYQCRTWKCKIYLLPVQGIGNVKYSVFFTCAWHYNEKYNFTSAWHWSAKCNFSIAWHWNVKIYVLPVHGIE